MFSKLSSGGERLDDSSAYGVIPLLACESASINGSILDSTLWVSSDIIPIRHDMIWYYISCHIIHHFLGGEFIIHHIVGVFESDADV